MKPATTARREFITPRRSASAVRSAFSAAFMLVAMLAPGSGAPAQPAAAPPALAPSGTAHFSDRNGSFDYAWFVPPQAKPPYPLVLVLPGCLENAKVFEAGTRWFEDARDNGYAVVMPQHDAAEMNPNGCFQYWDNHTRGGGEPAALAALVTAFAKDHPVDASRVYAAGFSAGAAMALALAADYPDVFAAVASGSGIEYQPCASDQVLDCYAALSDRSMDQDPVASGKAAYAQAKALSAAPTPGIFFHGDADRVVAPFNLELALRSFAVMNDGRVSHGAFGGAWTATPSGPPQHGVTPAGESYDHFTADDGALDWTVVHGMGHQWSGGVAGAQSNAFDSRNYNDPRGPDETIAFRTFLFRYRLAHP
jgi:poly(hydroxyalkanoate) depolymerase family esterase